MRDTMSIARANLLHPAIREEVINIINKVEAGFPETARIRIVQGLRTIDEQNMLFAKGRTAPGAIVTRARGGSSYHNYGLAFDFCFQYDQGKGFTDLSWDINYDFDKDGKKDWMEMVNAFTAAGYTWGGNFKSITDNPHLEKTFGYNWRDLLVKYNTKYFIKGTNYVML